MMGKEKIKCCPWVGLKPGTSDVENLNDDSQPLTTWAIAACTTLIITMPSLSIRPWSREQHSRLLLLLIICPQDIMTARNATWNPVRCYKGNSNRKTHVCVSSMVGVLERALPESFGGFCATREKGWLPALSRLVILRPQVLNSSSLKTWRLRSWLRDLVTKVLVSRPIGWGLGLETSGKVLISKLEMPGPRPIKNQSFFINIMPRDERQIG